MALVRRVGYCARIVIPLSLAAGCSLPASGPPTATRTATVAPPTRLPSPTPGPSGTRSGEVIPVAHRMPETPVQIEATADGLFAGQQELSLPQLVAEVQARNPSLRAMVYAWRAAAQRYPQVVRLDDPTFMTMMAPASFGSSDVESAYILQGAQKIPWFGKLQTRGRGALAEADAAFQDVQDARLVITQVTRIAFYDYYLAERQLQINDKNRQSAQEFRDSAQVKYETNQVTQQDVIQADVELTDLSRRQIELERMRRVAMARINVLLLRAPDAPLPLSAASLAVEFELPEADALRQVAMARRPDLAALGARVNAEQAALELALKQYYPDAEFFGRYDSFWQPASTQSDLRGQVGINMNVPIYRQRLNAAVCEAQFRLSQRRAEYRQRTLDIQYEVQSAYEQVEEARRTMELYAKNYLPLAEQNLTLTRTNYDVGKTTYLNLVMAQRQLFAVRERYEQALADYHRRLADLERAVGGALPEPVEELPRP